MAKWARSKLETDAVVVALDATDTDAEAADRLGCKPRTLVALATRREEVRHARQRQAERRRKARFAPAVEALDETRTATEAAARLGISVRRLVGFSGVYQEVTDALQRQRERRDDAGAVLRARAQQQADDLLAEIRVGWHSWSANTVGAKLRQLRGAIEIAKGARRRRSER